MYGSVSLYCSITIETQEKTSLLQLMAHYCDSNLYTYKDSSVLAIIINICSTYGVVHVACAQFCSNKSVLYLHHSVSIVGHIMHITVASYTYALYYILSICMMLFSVTIFTLR